MMVNYVLNPSEYPHSTHNEGEISHITLNKGILPLFYKKPTTYSIKLLQRTLTNQQRYQCET